MDRVAGTWRTCKCKCYSPSQFTITVTREGKQQVLTTEKTRDVTGDSASGAGAPARRTHTHCHYEDTAHTRAATIVFRAAE